VRLEVHFRVIRGHTPTALPPHCRWSGRRKSSSETTVFVYDGGGQLVAEYTALVGNDPAPTPRVSYLTQDHLGSPRVVTDQNGAVIKRTDWMAFGEEVEFSKRPTGLGYDEVPETRKGYTGYEKDDESGLDFAQARYYNPKHGRFTSVDPLTASANVKNPQTFNRYSYVLNSPYKFTDPLGLIPGFVNNAGWSGNCGAQFSSCDWDVDGGWFAEPTPDSAGDANAEPQTSTAGPASGSQQNPEPATPPPPPSAEQDQEVQLRSQFPTLNQADGGVVNEAVFDAENAATGLFSVMLVARFRNTGDTTTPRQALRNIVASTASSISVTRDANGQVTMASVAENAVYDGRTSTLLVDDDKDSNTPEITVSRYFQNNANVNAITYLGYIFVGQGFFNQNADGRAKSIVHEAVVHKGFGRRDTDFGPTRTKGSHAINAVIDTYFRRRDPVEITMEPVVLGTTVNLRTP
jgi:RHS repeat-associated protein